MGKSRFQLIGALGAKARRKILAAGVPPASRRYPLDDVVETLSRLRNEGLGSWTRRRHGVTGPRAGSRTCTPKDMGGILMGLIQDGSSRTE